MASEKIEKNQIIKSSMLSLKRPGTGLHPIYLKKIIGSKSKYHFEKNQKLKI